MKTKKSHKWVTMHTQTGNIINSFISQEEAKKAIEEYENEDKKNREFIENYYTFQKTNEPYRGD